MRLPPVADDWRGLPLERLLGDVVKRDDRAILGGGEILQVQRMDLDLAWTELRFIDDGERREACSRICLARASNVQALITMDFWAEDAERLGLVWDEALRSLQIAVCVDDPAQRRLQ